MPFYDHLLTSLSKHSLIDLTIEADGDLEVFVTGSVAAQIDFSSYLSQRLPYFFGAVLFLSFLLLMTVFRSIMVPLKAVAESDADMYAGMGRSANVLTAMSVVPVSCEKWERSHFTL